MAQAKKEGMSGVVLLCVIIGVILSFTCLEFLFPALYDPDSYYNIAVSGFIKNAGLHYKFRWAQFSTFKDSFADKDFVLHILSVPYLYITNDPVLAAKYSAILCFILFVLAYIFILRRYLTDYLAAAFLLLPFLSSIFSAYVLQLRSITLANILIITGIYTLINKRYVWLFIISALYALTHVSFFMLIIFAIICEVLRRYAFHKELFVKNIYTVIMGSCLGLVIHPNFPNNLMPIYLNGMLAPFYALTGIDLGFSGESMALDVRSALLSNFAVFFWLAIILWVWLRVRKKMGLSSAVWLAISGVYIMLAIYSMRYWYQANALFFIGLASYVSELLKDRERDKILLKIKKRTIIFFIIAIPLIIFNVKQLVSYLEYFAAKSAHYEDISRFMRTNIPENETIYHSNWDDSSYFICLNPKDNYINTNDPIYMFYRYPREFALMNDLSMGRVGNPGEVLSKIFKARYGYLRKIEPLYRQIAADPGHFKALYENGEGAVFEVL